MYYLQNISISFSYNFYMIIFNSAAKANVSYLPFYEEILIFLCCFPHKKMVFFGWTLSLPQAFMKTLKNNWR
jgi:hypothetical protein